MNRKLSVLILVSLLFFSVYLLSEAIESVGEIPKIVSSTEKSLRECKIDLRKPFWGGNDKRVLFQLYGTPATSYVRKFVRYRYDSGKWVSTESSESSYDGQRLEDEVKVFTQKKEMDVMIVPVIDLVGFIPAFSQPLEVKTTFPLSCQSYDQTFYSSGVVDEGYNVSYTNYWYSRELLNNAELEFDGEYMDRANQVFNPEIIDLAENVTSLENPPYIMVKNIANYLRINYVYNKDYAEAPSDVDPIEWFLFESHEGVCTHFNTALVLMARSMRIPARLVSGYLVEPDTNFQKIKASQKHAFAEIKFKDLGWVVFDATPSSFCCGGKLGEEEGDGKKPVKKENGEGIEEEDGKKPSKEENENGIEEEKEPKEEEGNETCKENGDKRGNETFGFLEPGNPPNTPLFRVYGKTGESYLRTCVGEIYTDDGWEMKEEDVHHIKNGFISDLVNLSSSKEYRNNIIKPLVEMRGFIPIHQHPIEIYSSYNVSYYPDQNLIYIDDEFNDSYRIFHVIHRYNDSLLVTAETVKDHRYLNIPANIYPRVHELAMEIVEEVNSPYEKLNALAGYLKENYEYSTNYSRPSENIDFVEWFLFHEKKGVCTHFNSALTLLARSLGIPTRLVGGYLIDPDAETQIVRGDQSHAYAEVLFKDLGWIIFDATGGERRCKSFDKKEKTETVTKITDQVSECLRGSNFTVAGTVKDTLDRPISGLQVLAYLKEEKADEGILLGESFVNKGRYNITCTIPRCIEVGDYLVEVDTTGNDVYNGSSSDPPLRILTETSIDLTAPEKVVAGREFNVSLILKEKNTDKPLNNKTCRVDTGFREIDVLTDSDGRVDIECKYECAGNHTLVAKWEGTEYHLSSQRSTSISSIPLKVIPETSNTMIRLEPFSIKGKIEADGIPGDGEEVKIQFGLKYINTTRTDETGHFEHKINVTEKYELGEESIHYKVLNCQYRLPPDKPVTPVHIDQEVEIYGRTKIKLSSVDEIRLDEDPMITATLLDDLGEPIYNASIKFRYPTGIENTTIEKVTDRAGRASIPLILEKRPKTSELKINVTYPGKGYHMASSDVDSVTVIKRKTPIFLILGVASAIVLGGILYLKRDMLLERVQDGDSEIPRLVSKNEKTEGIRIEFPQIEPPLPNVWGTDRDLLIKISLNKGMEAEDNFVYLAINEEEIELSLERDMAKTKKHFKEKGEYEFKATTRVSQLGLIEGSQKIRIVDYREEIIELFNREFDISMAKLQESETHFTARELKDMIAKNLPSKVMQSLDKMISIFEEADYSIHDITREEYVEYYKAYRRYKENAGEEKDGAR